MVEHAKEGPRLWNDRSRAGTRHDHLSPLTQSRFLVLSSAEAWKILPRADKGEGQALPLWARILAGPLPGTTAAMLELDYLHRCRSSLAPALRGKLRWIAANANDCEYTRTCAAWDLQRAGINRKAIQALAGKLDGFPVAERAALVFTDKLSRAAETVTDAEVQELVGYYGEKRVVAMVLLAAYASFQDRLILALGITAEPDGPLEPLDVHFKEHALLTAASAVSRPAPPGCAGAAPREAETGWIKLDYGLLRQALDRQRRRKPRIRLPPGQPGDNRWGAVCRAYQPEVAGAWSACTSVFEREADQDQAFAARIFWVVTRSLHCYY